MLVLLVTTKNRKNRTIYLAKQSIEFLKKLKQFCQNLPKFNENWFVFGKGELITDVIARNTIDRHLKKQYNRLKEKFPQKNINILTHHEFGRHSHASYLLSVGATLPDIYRIIAIRLGDTEEVIKNTYAHPYESENNDKTKKIIK